MRFLILTQYFPPEIGAAQVRLSAVAQELRKAGHEVEVVTALPNYPSGKLLRTDRGRLSRREMIDGIHITRLWLHTATGSGSHRLLSYLSFTVTGLVGALSARKPDVVLVESPPLFLGVAGWLAAKRFGASFVLNISDLWPDSVRDMGLMMRGPWLGWAEWLELWLYGHATAVTAVTMGIRDRLTTAKGVDAARVLFLPNGADTVTFKPVAAGLETASQHPLFLYTGNVGLAQALDVIIGAAELAPEIDFVLVGDGSDKSRLQAEARRRRLQNVRFEPPVTPDEISSIYRDAAAGIASLRHSELMQGARPAKMLAIMACGRPVLYAGSGEGAELVRAADAGIVVAPEDPAALAEAARAIVANPRRAAEMGSNGQQFVSKHLSWPVLVGDWLKDLGSVLGRSIDR